MAEKENAYGEKFLLPLGRFSYPKVFERGKGSNGKEGKYEVTLLIPKTTDISDVRARIDAVGKEAFGPAWRGHDKQKNLTIKDGDEFAEQKKLEGKDYEEYRGNWFVRCRTNEQPPCVDELKKRITVDRKKEIYGGCWGFLYVTPGSYNADGNKGVSLYLNAVQKRRDDEPFGNGEVDPDAVFQSFESDAAAAATGDDY